MFVGFQRNAPIHARLWIDQEMKKKDGLLSWRRTGAAFDLFGAGIDLEP